MQYLLEHCTDLTLLKMFISTKKSVTNSAILTDYDIIRTFNNWIFKPKPARHDFRFDEETDPTSHDKHERWQINLEINKDLSSSGRNKREEKYSKPSVLGRIFFQ